MLSHSGNSLAALFRRLTQYIQRCLYDQPGLPPANKKTTKSNQALTYPLDGAIGFPNTYPLDSDLSGG